MVTRTLGAVELVACGGGYLVLGAALIATVPAAALEWSSTPLLRLGAGEDSNVRLQPSGGEDVASSSLAAQTDIVGRTTGLELRLTPRVRSLRYDDPHELDRDDAYADVGLTKSGTRQRWTLSGGYANEGTLTTALESTGFVETDVARTQSSLGSSWLRVGEHGRYELAVNGIDVRYEDALFSPLVDYRYAMAQAAYTRTTGERSSWRFSLARSLLSAESSPYDNVSSELRATWTHTFSPALSARVGVGGFNVATRGQLSPDDDSSGVSLDLDVSRAWPRWRFSANGSRELQPDGRGTLVREDRVNLGASRRVTERFSIGAGVLVAQVASQGLDSIAYDREYGQASLTLGWDFGRRWSFSGAFHNRAQESPFSPYAHGFISELAVSYRGR